MKKIFFCATAVVIALQALAQQVEKGLTAANGSYIGFLQYTPADYNTTTNLYPLIIFLHGMGERGNGTTDLHKVTVNAIPSYIDKGLTTMTFTWNGKTETFLVLSPQLSLTYSGWQDFYVDEMIKYARANLRVDTNRIFLTGFSMGGGGVWSYSSDASGHSGHFAAIVPVCPTCTFQSGCNVAEGKTRVWTFHAVDDSTASITCTLLAVADINNCNPPTPPLMTTYLNGDHFIWDRAYNLVHTWQNPNVYEWMLNQDRSLPVNKYPIVKGHSQLDPSPGKVLLNATGSYDPDGNIITFIWRKVSGPAGAAIQKPQSDNGSTNITNLTNPGLYVYELKGIDNRAAYTTDTLTITVTSSGAIIINQSPLANAGADITINLPVSTATLDGSGSSDPENQLAGYSWTKVSGPDQSTITDPNAKTTNVTNLKAGIYQFRLLVSDAGGLTSADTVKVTVNVLTDVPPTPDVSRDTLFVSPNPFSSEIDISFASPQIGKVMIRAFDGNGRLVLNATSQKVAPRFTYKASVGGLRAGPYYIEVSMDKKRMVSKVLKR